MSLFEAIVNQFNAHLDATSRSIEALTPHIAEAVHLLIETLTEDRKILCCTSDHAIAAGSQFCNLLQSSPNFDRPSLPAILLEAKNVISLMENSAVDETFARQINAFANTRDLLLVISSSGNEPALLQAVDAAISKNMHIIALTGGDHSGLSDRIPSTEVNIPVTGLSSSQTTGIQFILAQMLSELIEQQLFGSADL